MKMSKAMSLILVITIYCIVIHVSNSYAVDSNPTLDSTMSWISRKLNQINRLVNFEYNGCVLVMKKDVDIGDNSYTDIYTVDLSKVTEVKFNKGDFTLSGNSGTATKTWTRSLNRNTSTQRAAYITIQIPEASDEDMSRLIKGVNHARKLCGATDEPF